MNVFLKRKQQCESNPIVQKRSRRSDIQKFCFLKHCIFCGEVCNVKKTLKNPVRWRKSYMIRTDGDIYFKGSILRVTCAQRNDRTADEVRTRVQGAVSDLHAADARYHVDRRARIMTTLHVQSSSSTASNTSEACEEAFRRVIDHIEQDKSRIWNAVDINDLYVEFDGVILQRKSCEQNQNILW